MDLLGGHLNRFAFRREGHCYDFRVIRRDWIKDAQTCISLIYKKKIGENKKGSSLLKDALRFFLAETPFGFFALLGRTRKPKHCMAMA